MNSNQFLVNLSLLSLILLFLGSCGSDDSEDTTPTPVDFNNIITADVNGDSTTFLSTFRSELGRDNIYLYDGETSDRRQVITVRAVLDTTGTFDVNDSTNNFYSVQWGDVVSIDPYDAIPYTMSTGTLTITANTIDKFEGTFSGTVINVFDSTDTRTLTNGVFKYNK